MLTPKILEGFAEQFAQMVGEGPQKTHDEIRKNAQQLMQSAFARMDLVTREEFDTQQAVLERTRALVDALEKRLAELEAAADQDPKA